jgi:hypothetical protein
MDTAGWIAGGSHRGVDRLGGRRQCIDINISGPWWDVGDDRAWRVVDRRPTIWKKAHCNLKSAVSPPSFH